MKNVHRLLAGGAGLLLSARAALAVTPCPLPAGTSGMCGFTATAGVPVAVTSGTALRYLAIANDSTAVRMICSRDKDAANTPLILGAPSTYVIQPGALQEFTISGTAYVPPQVTSCAPESGTASGMVEVSN